MASYTIADSSSSSLYTADELSLVKSILYKTKKCKRIDTPNGCKLGNKCGYAHSDEELLNVEDHPFYKKYLCTMYFVTGKCKYEGQCPFVHKMLPPLESSFATPPTSTRESYDSPQLLHECLNICKEKIYEFQTLELCILKRLQELENKRLMEEVERQKNLKDFYMSQLPPIINGVLT